MRFEQAIDAAVADAMAQDDGVIVMGEDVHLLRRGLYSRFGEDRVLPTPISEAAFLGAGVGAAMAGMRPVVEIMLVDFIGVCLDALLNQAAKLSFFSNGTWDCPLVVRATCGGGYGDGGQHEQCLWGMLAGIPGLTVVAPATPADAGGLMASAIAHPGPVVLLEHKLLAKDWLDYMGRGGRDNVEFDVPEDGATGEVASPPVPVPLGVAAVRRAGKDLTIVTACVGVHRSLAAADELARRGVQAEVIDLRTLQPLDRDTVTASVAKTGKLLVVDEDYRDYGLSGELAASVLEAGTAAAFWRVCNDGTIGYSRELEAQALPSVERVLAGAERLLAGAGP